MFIIYCHDKELYNNAVVFDYVLTKATVLLYTQTVLIVLIQLQTLKRRDTVILLDYKDRRPIYEQVIEKFQQMILCGALQAGEAMPSVRSLAMELSLNPNTIQRAYQELERKGYIYSIKGKGSFVSDSRDAAISRREEIKEELDACVEKAFAAGISVEELTGMLMQSIEERKRGGEL